MCTYLVSQRLLVSQCYSLFLQNLINIFPFQSSLFSQFYFVFIFHIYCSERRMFHDKWQRWYNIRDIFFQHLERTYSKRSSVKGLKCKYRQIYSKSFVRIIQLIWIYMFSSIYFEFIYPTWFLCKVHSRNVAFT